MRSKPGYDNVNVKAGTAEFTVKPSEMKGSHFRAHFSVYVIKNVFIIHNLIYSIAVHSNRHMQNTYMNRYLNFIKNKINFQDDASRSQ